MDEERSKKMRKVMNALGYSSNTELDYNYKMNGYIIWYFGRNVVVHNVELDKQPVIEIVKNIKRICERG